MTSIIQETTIEMRHGRPWLCQRGEYGEDSVLAGQGFCQLCKPYDTVEEAIAENPDAHVDLDGYQPEAYVPSEPPAWFNPADAGEVWSEDDY